MELVMFVGITVSGKRTHSAAYQEQGYLILSSDEIRENLMDGAVPEKLSEKEKANI